MSPMLVSHSTDIQLTQHSCAALGASSPRLERFWFYLVLKPQSRLLSPALRASFEWFRRWHSRQCQKSAVNLTKKRHDLSIALGLGLQSVDRFRKCWGQWACLFCCSGAVVWKLMSPRDIKEEKSDKGTESFSTIYRIYSESSIDIDYSSRLLSCTCSNL